MEGQVVSVGTNAVSLNVRDRFLDLPIPRTSLHTGDTATLVVRPERILAVIASPLEHGVLTEGMPVAFEFPPGTTHLLSGSPGCGA